MKRRKEKRRREDGGEGEEGGEERREGGAKKREKEDHGTISVRVGGSPTTSNSPDQNPILRKNNLGTSPFRGNLLIPEGVITLDIYVYSKPFTRKFIPASPFLKNALLRARCLLKSPDAGSSPTLGRG